MINFVALDGGDLGKLSIIDTTNHFIATAIKVGYILKDLNNILQQHKFTEHCPCYGFNIPIHLKDKLIPLMEDISKLLPIGVEWYETNGIKLFEIRGSSGGIVSSLAYYLIAYE